MPFDVYPVGSSRSPEAIASDIARKVNFAEEHGGRLITDISVAVEPKKRLSPQNLATFLVFEYEGEPPANLPWENSATPEQIREATERALGGH
jgi:hypothetical protein